MQKKSGKVIIHGDVHVWSHEEETAKALAAAGYVVEFIRASTIDGEHSADAFIEGEKYEFKSPRSSKLSSVEDNLKKASKQSDKVVFDSRRMKRLPDKAIFRELSAQLKRNTGIFKIKFINRHGKVVDIK